MRDPYIAPVCTRRPFTIAPGCHCASCRRTCARNAKLLRNGFYRSALPIRDQARAQLDYMVLSLKYTRLAVASACGVPEGTATNWVSSSRRGVKRDIGRGWCEAILNAKHPTAGYMTAEISRRMLQALACLGHSSISLAKASGVSDHTLTAVRGKRTERVEIWLHDAIVALYNEFSMTRRTGGGATQLTDRASRFGWLPPAAWDDITDLSERPVSGAPRHVYDVPIDMTAIERRLAGGKDALGSDGKLLPLTTREARQLVAIGILRGMTVGAITALGVSPWHKHIRYNVRWATPATTQLYAVHTNAGWSYHDELLEAC